MTDKCREAFEKAFKSRHPITRMTDVSQALLKSQFEEWDYVDPGTQSLWEAHKLAWNASHDRCVEICKQEPPLCSVSTKEITNNDAINAIQNDKVKL